MHKKSILLFTDWYEPGFKAGGPIKSCVNFVNEMSTEYNLYIFTSDRDLGEVHPYDSIDADKWLDLSASIKIFYASPANLNYRSIRNQVNNIQPDFIYLNSMFSYKFSLLPLLISRFSRALLKVILAPRGMLKSSALQFKPAKKKLFLSLFRVSGISNKIIFHATDPSEVEEVKFVLGNSAAVKYIPNFSGAINKNHNAICKKAGQISIAFIGRVHPVKNLYYLIDCLNSVKGQFSLTVVGNIEDENYYNDCLRLAERHKLNDSIHYLGSRPSSEINSILQSNHILVLPTVGENFGHAIYESLSNGRPVIISNNTPWKDLAAHHAGFDISLDQKEKFIAAIQYFIDMDNTDFIEWSEGSRAFALTKSDNQQLKKKYIQLFS